MKKVMIIINPTSGGEKALDYKEKIENKAKEYFDVVETRITEKAKDATIFAEEAVKEEVPTKEEALLAEIRDILKTKQLLLLRRDY